MTGCLPLLPALLLALLYLGPAEALAEETAKKILIVHSYGPGQACAQPQDDGLVEGLAARGLVEGRSLLIERFYMRSDTKFLPGEIAQSGREALALIERLHPDLVVILDDPAAQEVMLPLAGSTTPVVFSGINTPPETYGSRTSFLDSREQPGHNVTGVHERLYLARSLQVMREVLPGPGKIVFLVDTSPTGQALREEIESEMAAGGNDMLYAIWQTDDLSEYRQYIRRINSDQEIGTYFPACTSLRAKDGTPADMMEILAWTLSRSNKPALTTNDYLVELGIFGGAVINYRAMGRQAALKAAAILGGTPAGDLPVEEANGSGLHFNLARARQLGVRIPPELLGAAETIHETIGLPITPVIPKVFFIHSFGEEYAGSGLQEQGVLQALNEAGFRGERITLRRFFMDTQQHHVQPEEVHARGQAALQAIAAEQPDVVVVFDDTAVLEVMLPLAGTDLPVLFGGMNLPPEVYNSKKKFMQSRERPGSNISGVVEAVPYDQTLRLFRLVVPDARTMVLLEPMTTPWMRQLIGYFEERFVAQVKRHGFSEVRRVRVADYETFQQKSLQAAQDPSVDAICVLPPLGFLRSDQSVVPAEEALAWYFSVSKKPGFTFLVHWVEYGYLMAVGINPGDSGRQLGNQLVRVLRGEHPATIAIEQVNKPSIAINLQRAEQLGLTFPMEVLESAHRIYRSIPSPQAP